MSPVPFCVHELLDAVQFFKIICQCSFHASLLFLAYHCSVEIDWKDSSCVGWFPYDGKTGDLLSIPKCEVPGTNEDHEGMLAIEKISQIDVTYEPSEKISLNDCEEAL